MPVSPDVARVRFSALVTRALADARRRGMRDGDIERATGIGSSTFHRWRKGEFSRPPGIDKVTSFFGALSGGEAVRDALAALGADDQRGNPAPSPPPDPYMQRVLRALADPAVPEEDKLVIREMLKLIARRADDAPRSRVERRSS